MITLSYKKEINAPAGVVWDILWNDKTYQQWTKPFSPGSQIQSDWKVGGKTLFTDGEGNGMVSTIKSLNKPGEIIFEHIGELKDGVEDTTSEKVKKFQGSLEKYNLKEEDGTTTLLVSVDTAPEYQSMMDSGFVSGLQIVKELAEH